MDYGNMLIRGNATLTYDPTLAKHVSTKSYVDNAATYTANTGSGLTLTGKNFTVNTTGVSLGVTSNNVVVRSTGTADQVLRSTGTAGVEATWGALNLASANAVTGALAITNGGTGATSAANARTALGAVGVYRTTFTNASVSAGLLTVTHNLGNKIVNVQISDNSDKVIQPDDITLSTTANAIVDLTSYGTITGTWNVIVTG